MCSRRQWATQTGYGTTSVWCRGGSRYFEGWWGFPHLIFLDIDDLWRFSHRKILFFFGKPCEKTIVLDPRKIKIIQQQIFSFQRYVRFNRIYLFLKIFIFPTLFFKMFRFPKNGFRESPGRSRLFVPTRFSDIQHLARFHHRKILCLFTKLWEKRIVLGHPEL